MNNLLMKRTVIKLSINETMASVPSSVQLSPHTKINISLSESLDLGSATKSLFFFFSFWATPSRTQVLRWMRGGRQLRNTDGGKLTLLGEWGIGASILSKHELLASRFFNKKEIFSNVIKSFTFGCQGWRFGPHLAVDKGSWELLILPLTENMEGLKEKANKNL